MMKLLIVFVLIAGIKAQDSLICVDRLGIVGTLTEIDSLDLQLEKHQALIVAFENDTTAAKSLIREQKNYIGVLKKQRLKYKKNWINSERSRRMWRDVTLYTGSVAVVLAMTAFIIK